MMARNKRHKLHTSRERSKKVCQPFLFTECFDIKLEEGGSAYVPFLHIQRELCNIYKHCHILYINGSSSTNKNVMSNNEIQ